MSLELRPYPEYKDSHVEWLGSVPEHWNVLPNRALFTIIDDRNHPEEQLLSVTISQGVIPQESLLASTAKKDGSNLDKTAYKLVQLGDIVYNKMRAWQGAVGSSGHRGIVSPAYVVTRGRVPLVPRYYHFLLRTPAFATEAERWSYGITSDQWSLRPDHFRLIYSTLPPLDEQSAIVHFLDRIDLRFRRLIRAKRRQIELLNEQKQAIIHQAVTRGLNPDVPLKPSGVEWLGDVPAHWEVVPNRSVLRFRKEVIGSHSGDYTLLSLTKAGIIPRDLDNPEGKFPSSFDTYQRIESGDLVFCLFDIDETPRTVGLSTLEGMITGAYTRFSCDPSAVEFVYHFFLAMDNGKRLKPVYTGLRKVIPKTTFLSMKLPLPPPSERIAIVEHIRVTTGAIDRIVERTQREIDLIREYRTRLIADVVTGKLDVRGVELPELGEADDVPWDEDDDTGDGEIEDVVTIVEAEE